MIIVLILVSWREVTDFVNAVDNPTVLGNVVCMWQREIDWSWDKPQNTEWYID